MAGVPHPLSGCVIFTTDARRFQANNFHFFVAEVGVKVLGFEAPVVYSFLNSEVASC
jgi:hypothetical protein